jgi:hypothetical protein
LQSPDFPPMSAETLEAIGERHNLHAEEISPLEDVGIFNSIYLVGSEYVLRVPRVAPPFVAAIRKESVAVPAARAAGVRTPALVALDNSLEILPAMLLEIMRFFLGSPCKPWTDLYLAP